MADWILGIKITPIGDGKLEHDATLADGRYRLASRVPSWDTSDVYRSYLTSFPAEIGSKVEWHTGKVSIGGLDIQLKAVPETLGWLARMRHRKLGELDTALTAAATSLSTDIAGLSEETIVIGREAIYLDSDDGGGDYSSCARGVLGTDAYPHGVGDRADVELYDCEESSLYDLPVELFRVPATGGYGDEETLWTGVIQSVSWDGNDGFLRLVCDSALEVLSRTRVCRRLARFRTEDGVSFLTDPASPASAPAVDDDGADSAPFPEMLFSDGDRTVLGYAIKSSDGSWGVKINPNASPPVSTWDGGKSQWEVDPESRAPKDGPDEVWQVLSTVSGAPPVNRSGDTLSNNAVELALQLLTTTEAGGNGSWDLGDPNADDDVARAIADLGAGISTTLLDVAGMEEIADRYGDLIKVELTFPEDGKSFEPLAFIRDRLLRPFGLVLLPGADNKLTIRPLEDGAVPATSLTDADFTGKPELTVRGVPAVDEVEVEWGKRPGLEPNRQTFSSGYTLERSVAGRSTSLSIDAGGVRSLARATQVGVDYATRYFRPIPIVRLAAKRTLDVALGDVVAVTHRVLPGPTGTKGVTAEVMVVSGREYDLETGQIYYSFWWTSAAYGNVGRIGPAARVDSYDSGTDVATVEANAFIPSGLTVVGADGEEYTTDAGAFEGIFNHGGTVALRILDSDLSQRGTATLKSADGAANELELAFPSVNPVADDVIVLDKYDDVGSEERNRYAFQADANETLGSTPDDADEWVS